MTLPTIHSNGTGKNTLEHDYMNARARIMDALRAFEAIEFNARDYYPQGPNAFTAAREERAVMARKLVDVREYLTAHTDHISDA